MLIHLPFDEFVAKIAKANEKLTDKPAFRDSSRDEIQAERDFFIKRMLDEKQPYSPTIKRYWTGPCTDILIRILTDVDQKVSVNNYELESLEVLLEKVPDHLKEQVQEHLAAAMEKVAREKEETKRRNLRGNLIEPKVITDPNEVIEVKAEETTQGALDELMNEFDEAWPYLQ